MEVYYINHKNQKIDLGRPPYQMQIGDVFNFLHKYEGSNFKLKRIYKDIATIRTSITISASDDEEFCKAVNNFYEITEVDTISMVQGRLYVGDYYILCNILSSEKEFWEDMYNGMENYVKLLVPYPYWCREETKTFPKKSNESIATYAESSDYYASASGTVDVTYGAESFGIDTGLESIDSIVVFQDPTTSSETYGWIYCDSCKGYVYSSTIAKQFVLSSSSIVINGGNTTLFARNSDYPIKQTSFRWVAYGKKAGSDTYIKKTIEFEIPQDTSEYTVETGLSDIGAAIIRRTGGYSSENGTHMFLLNSAVNGYSYYKKDTYLSYNYFATSKELISAEGGNLTINEVSESYPIRDGSYSCIVYENTGKEDPGTGETTDDDYLTYPYEYPYGYPDHGEKTSFLNDHYADCDFQMIIYGPCTDPAVRINGHLYEVITTLYESEYMVIDSRNNLVTRYRNDGTTENLYNNRNKRISAFKKIPAGVCSVSWNSEAFGFDITLFQERSEPKWSL